MDWKIRDGPEIFGHALNVALVSQKRLKLRNLCGR